MPRDKIAILSKSLEKSKIGGAQYLHQPILDENVPADFVVDHLHVGGAEGYAAKVYCKPDEKTSWDNHDSSVGVWSLESTYNKLFMEWFDRIELGTVDDGRDMEFLKTLYRDGLISTIPAYITCMEGHDFPVVKSRIVPMYYKSLPKNIVLYSGRKEDRWYRMSNIQERCWAEFREDKTPQAYVWKSLPAIKPLGTDCNCCSKLGIVRMGRFGLWDRQVLLHHVVTQVENAVCAGLIAQ